MMVVGGGCRLAGLRRKRCEFVGGERERDRETQRKNKINNKNIYLNETVKTIETLILSV